MKKQEPPCLIQEQEAVYHSKRGLFLASHLLAFFRLCPKYYRLKVTRPVESSESKALRFGRALHKMVLEGGAAFDLAYAVGGPINPQTGRPYGTDTQKFAAWEAQTGKIGISAEDMDLLFQMAASIACHSHASKLLSQGWPERVVRLEVLGLPCQARFDWINPDRGIVDLKTCEDLDWFEHDARKYHYLHQAAFYHMLLEAASGVSVPFHFVAIEKNEPFRTGVWEVTREALGLAQLQNERAMTELKECMAANHWPTRYEDIRQLDLH